jgi:HEPN domain-containing protein
MDMMEQGDIVNYWVETANSDFRTMLNLYESKDYHWSLFMGHLVLERLLKAIYVEKYAEHAPRTHDLLRLAQETGIPTTEEQKDALDLITTFNINARYPDYKRSFYKKCTKEFTAANIEKIKELRTWLLSMINNK